MQGYYQDPWGRRYKFNKYPCPAWLQRKGVTEDYSHTEVQNFMVQGFATGSIVLGMLGLFWRQKALHNRDKYLLINTIHDSVMLDCRKEYTEDAKKDLLILENVAIISEQVFNYKFLVPIKVDTKTGENWFNC